MGALNEHLGADRMPGMGPVIEQETFTPFLKDQSFIVRRGVVIEKDSEDAGHTGKETKLRPGCVVVRIETGANKGKYVPVDHASAPVAASVQQAGILENVVSMRKRDGTDDVEDQHALIVIGGVIDQDEIILVDALYIEEVKAALPLCHFILDPA